MASTTSTDVQSQLPDKDLGSSLIIMTGVLSIFIVLTTGIRTYVRIRTHLFKLDDWMMLFATLSALTRYFLQIAQVENGFGRHIVYLDNEELEESDKLGFFSTLLLFASMGFLKTSIILVVVRILGERWLRVGLYSILAGIWITHLGVDIIYLAQCQPISAFWNGDGVCWTSNLKVYWIQIAIAYCFATDLICSLLPLVVMWKIKLSTKKRILILCLTSLGLIASGFGLATVILTKIGNDDRTYEDAKVAITSNGKIFLGIIAANLALSISIYRYFSVLFGIGTVTELQQSGCGRNEKGASGSSTQIPSSVYSSHSSSDVNEVDERGVDEPPKTGVTTIVDTSTSSDSVHGQKLNPFKTPEREGKGGKV